MKNKGQVVIISLWMLVILSVLAISLGHRVSMALKLNQYRVNKLKALYLAKAGVNRAIIEIAADKTPDFDALTDNWANNSTAFQKIFLNANLNEFAVVSYDTNQDNNTTTIFGIIDEQRKININSANEFLLLALLEKYKVENPEDVTTNILIWRGEKEDAREVYKQAGYPAKKDKFSNIEELQLIPGITAADYQNLKISATVSGDGSLNINTVPQETLSIVTDAISKELSLAKNSAESVTSKIMELRKVKGHFTSKEDINIELTGEEETNIFNNLLEKITFQSSDFLIEVTGNASKIKSKITAVYNRTGEQLTNWHED
ncbi:MAG: type II secretion system protein GspK [Candidatus Omnitrophica bacterium]|nr:type II secretion system protein GspK [Candidatus Omnitrophota bacterium]